MNFSPGLSHSKFVLYVLCCLKFKVNELTKYIFRKNFHLSVLRVLWPGELVNREPAVLGLLLCAVLRWAGQSKGDGGALASRRTEVPCSYKFKC